VRGAARDVMASRATPNCLGQLPLDSAGIRMAGRDTAEPVLISDLYGGLAPFAISRDSLDVPEAVRTEAGLPGLLKCLQYSDGLTAPGTVLLKAVWRFASSATAACSDCCLCSSPREVR